MLRRRTRQRSAGVARRAVILDGRTLNIDLELWQEPTGPVELVFTPRGGGASTVAGSLRLREPRRYTATALLDSAGADLSIGSWTVGVRMGQATHPVVYQPSEELNSATIRPETADERDGLVRHVSSSNAGALQLDVREPEPSVHTDDVDTSLYRLRVAVRPVATEIEGAELRLRGATASIPIPMREAADRWILELPLDQLSESAEIEENGASNVWKLVCITAAGEKPLMRSLSDLQSPRGAVRYDTVVLSSPGRRERFRPYWTLGGSLVVEHRRTEAPAETVS